MKLKNMYGDKKTGKILFEVGILIMVVNLLCAIGIWQSITNGWKVTNGSNLFFQAFIQSGGNYVITYLNQESIYISFLSVIFSFLGNKEELVSVINLILQLAGAGFFYLGARKLFRFVFPLAVVIISGFLSGCFYPVITDSSMHMIWFLSGCIFWLIAKGFHDSSRLFLKHILLGILLGIFSYIDWSGFFLIITCVLFTVFTKEYSLKEKGLQLLYFFMCSINVFFCMFYLWNDFLFNSHNFKHWFADKSKHLSMNSSLYQYISLGIVLLVCIIFYIIRYYDKNTDSSTVELDDVFKQIALQEEKEIMEESEAVQSESEKPIKFLENPLPVPKKHVRKEMNYAFEPSKDQMHYDLNNYRLDDDYDLKD